MTVALARRARLRGLALLPLIVPSAAAAANRAIEDVRLAREGAVATVDIVLVCPVDYLDHVPAAGPELSVRVELASECVEALGTGIRSELHEPPRTTVAAMRQVRFDTRDGREARIVVSVSPSQRFEVGQGRGRNIIRIELRTPEPLPETTSQPVPSLDPPPPAAAPPPPAERRPLRLVQRPAAPRERFALQLASGTEAADRAAGFGPEFVGGRSLYVNEHAASDGDWYELRLGFFDTEQEARAFVTSLPAPYTNSVVVVADVAEQERASAFAMPIPAAESMAPPAPQFEPLTPERLATLTAAADEALLAGDHDTAVRLYARLLEDPAFAERRTARERLGVARERKGQLAQARAEYQAYLAEFPEGADSDRVRQRLAGLAATAAPVVVDVREPRGTASRWDITGGAAQYVRYFELDRPGTAAPAAEQSALWSNVNLVVRRDGERFELLNRLDAAYRYDLRDAPERAESADQFLVSNAYVDVADGKHDWQARVGRQTRYGSGILGRFDGAAVSYRWRPDIALNLALGYPVDFPRHALDTHRRFVGVSADLDRLVRQWDFSFFGVLQTVDGIADREAIGAEARYRGERWHVVAAVDADPSYSVVNSALVNATWRVTDKLSLNGRFNGGAAPFIATRNALIGQSAVLVDTLLDTYTEQQLRRIARDRTAQIEQGTIGLTRPLLDRFQLSADFGYYDSEGTVASAGIAAVPSVQQTFVNLAFVGSSVFKDGDSAVVALRHVAGPDVSGDTLTFDVRLPTRGRWRLNPRLALSSRRYADASATQWVAAPMMRLALRWPNRHQFELELGARLSTRELAAADGAAWPRDEESMETFINAGYWWELGR